MKDISFNIVTPKTFKKYLIKNKRLEFFTVYTEVEMRPWRLLLTEEAKGGAGFAITPDKELVNIFNNTDIKGLGRAMVRCAIDLGVNRVFCFDGFLRDFYTSFGFRVVKWRAWDSKLAPANWNYGKYGKPRVLWFERG